MPANEPRLPALTATDHADGAEHETLVAQLVRLWPADCVIDLLEHDSPAVVAAAAEALGQTGSLRHTPRLVSLLGAREDEVAHAAEDALWAIWMRAGSTDGNLRLADAIGRIQRDDYHGAQQVLERLVAAEPGFAEPHHQLGIVHTMMERLSAATEAYRRAIDLNPLHFAATAALGHLAVAQRDLPEALRQYRAAVRIHPRLDDLQMAIVRIERALQGNARSA